MGKLGTAALAASSTQQGAKERAASVGSRGRMSDPSNALLLYVLVVIFAFLLSPRWASARAVLFSAGTAAQAKTASASTTKGATSGSNVKSA